jgi:hypothetical protein
MTDTSKLFAALIASLIVVSSLGGVAIAPADAQTSGTEGMLALGDAQVSEDVPADADLPIRASDLKGAVYASDYADTLEVVLTTPERAEEYMGENASVLADDEIAIVLRDDQVSEGRDVAIDLEVLEAGVGFVPEVAYGTHEDGERWTSPIERDGTVGRFNVPHFSENAVTFTGGVEITAAPATDGSQFTYELSDLDSASNVTVNLTGTLNTENESFQTQASGGTEIGTFAGTEPITGATVQITGTVIRDNSPGTLDINSVGEYQIYASSSADRYENCDIYAYYNGSQIYSFSNNLKDGQSEIRTVATDLTDTKTGSLTASAKNCQEGSASISWTDTSPPTNNSIDYPGGSEPVKNLTDGETVSVSISSELAPGDPVTFESEGVANVNLSGTEATTTSDPTVELNSESVSHDGTLGDGETSSFSISSSALQEGTNRVNVSVGDGSLSSDAPPAAVGLELSHEATDEQTVDYGAEIWSERYNVSRTYGDATEEPTLTIPFEGEVVDINSVDVRRNGGPWGPPKEWVLDNTTLTVGFDPIDAGDTLEVRATGRKVITRNGDIQVLEPTVEGDSLNSKIEITDRSEGFAIDVSGSDRIHHTAEESWLGSSYVVVESGGDQELRLPEASVGSQTRVRTAPLNVVPESGASEVVIEEAEEPRFRIREGNTTGTATVDVTYYDTLSGERYVLWSESQEREIDADRAESPVEFRTDGSADTYTIRQQAAPGSTGGGAPIETRDVGAPLVLVVPAVGISVAGLFWAGRRFGGARGIRGNALLLVGSTVVAIAAVELVAPGTISSIVSTIVFALGDSVAGGLGAAVAAVAVFVGLWQLQQRTRADIPWWVLGPAMGIAAIAALEAIRPGSVLGALEVVLSEYGGLVVLGGLALVGYVIYQRRQTQQAEASTPDTSVTLDLGNSEE